MNSKITFIDKDEEKLSKLIEKGDGGSMSAKEKKEISTLLSAAAINSKAKRMVVNLRLPKRDLLMLKTSAAEEGIPYQTYIASILHKYVTGKLV